MVAPCLGDVLDAGFGFVHTASGAPDCAWVFFRVFSRLAMKHLSRCCYMLSLVWKGT